MKDSNLVASDWPVWILLVILLSCGFGLQAYVLGQSNRVEWEGMTLQIPLDWLILEKGTDRIETADFRAGNPFGPRLVIRKLEKQTLLPHGGGLWEAAVNWSTVQAESYGGYRILRMNPLKVRNVDGVELHSAYFLESGVNEKPGLMLSREIILPVQDHFYVWAFSAEENAFAQTTLLQKRLLSGWSLNVP